MIVRLVTLVALAAAIAAGIATAAPAAGRNCGTVKSGGATWSVVTAGVSCGAAKPLVQKLATKPHPSVATRLGTYLGMKCIEFARGSKREIACVATNGGKSVYGVTPPKK
jgi:hypothetical protein